MVAEHLDRTLRELGGLGGVGGVAAFHKAIHDQPGGAAGEEHLVAVQRVAAILADDVGVRLEDRDHLLGRRHGLMLEDAAACLIEDPIGELDVVLELGAELAKLGVARTPRADSAVRASRRLATLRFVAQGKNVLLAGMSGTGKSHIALALALLACNANQRVLYTTSADMLAQLHMSLADDTLVQALKPYTRAEVLVCDEVGLEQVERNEARRSGLMQKVLLPRYNERRSTVITTNQTRYAPSSRKFDGDPGPSYWGASTVGACALGQRTRWPRGGSCRFIKAATARPWFTQRRRPAQNGRRCRRSCSRS